MYRLDMRTQKPEERRCGQCCVATLLNMDVDRVCELMRKKAGTNKSHLAEFLECSGWEVGETVLARSRSSNIKNDSLIGAGFGYPHDENLYAIVKCRFRDIPGRNTPQTHWMLWWAMDNRGLYCPDRGRLHIKDWIQSTAPNQSEAITSYFVVTPRT